MVVTGKVSDETLRFLYQQSDAFVFPSSYEGFGLPLLEAMQCGLPVLAGNNSAQIEVVGDAGLLVNVNDCNDIAATITRLLDDSALRKTLSERALAQASGFSWKRSADLALEALNGRGAAEGIPPHPLRPGTFAQADDRLFLSISAAQVRDLRLFGVAPGRASSDLPNRPVSRLGLRARAGLDVFGIHGVRLRSVRALRGRQELSRRGLSDGQLALSPFHVPDDDPPPGSGDPSRLLSRRVSSPLRGQARPGFRLSPRGAGPLVPRRRQHHRERGPDLDR